MFIDLSHRLKNGLITFPGDPPIEIDIHISREEMAEESGWGSAAQIDRIRMINTSGTYVDAPYHRFPDGYLVSEIPLEKCANLEYEVCVLPEGKRVFTPEVLGNAGRPGGAVLLCTGWDRYFEMPQYGIKPPCLSVEGARLLMERGVVFIGIDTPLIDDLTRLSELGCAVHDIILGAGGVVCEDMTNLAAAIPYAGTGKLFAAPAKAEMASFTVRAYVVV